MNPNTRIPVLAPDNTRLMPTKYRRAKELVNQREAQWLSNDLNIKAIRLLRLPSGYKIQAIVLGVDPGKLFTGMGLISSRATLLLLHLMLPFERVLGNLHSAFCVVPDEVDELIVRLNFTSERIGNNALTIADRKSYLLPSLPTRGWRSGVSLKFSGSSPLLPLFGKWSRRM